MRELVRNLKPSRFEDIVALVALFRPGPLKSGMVDDFIQRKEGLARVTYPHPQVEPILQATHGVILYQEQVMQIARELAGYSLGGADVLRKAMGKKLPEEMARERAAFVSGGDPSRGGTRTSRTPSSTSWSTSPSTGSTARTPSPTRSCPTRRRGSSATIRLRSWPPR